MLSTYCPGPNPLNIFKLSNAIFVKKPLSLSFSKISELKVFKNPNVPRNMKIRA